MHLYKILKHHLFKIEKLNEIYKFGSFREKFMIYIIQYQTFSQSKKSNWRTWDEGPFTGILNYSFHSGLRILILVEFILLSILHKKTIQTILTFVFHKKCHWWNPNTIDGEFLRCHMKTSGISILTVWSHR